MADRLEQVESRLIKMEKKDRRNNAVIKGVNFGEQNIKEGVAEFLHIEITANANIIEAAEIKTKAEQKTILIKLENGEVKKDIEEDMTKEERKIQARLKEKWYK